MSYWPWLEGQALRQMNGLPDEALGILTRTMARISEDPYDRLLSMAVRDDGFIEFKGDEAAQLVRVYSLIWLS